jgi:putative Mg2+ transporter-C (MgtC) family protein
MSADLAISTTEVLLRLGLAAGLGMAVGIERERLDRAAGLRTHALVCIASALVMIVSAFGFTDALGFGGSNVSLDPSRVAAQVVSGVGFLGAGVIIFRGNAVHGLTTAASLWAIAGIGLACGGGLYLAAILATGIILGIQSIIRPLEHRYSRRRLSHHLEISLDPNTSLPAEVRRRLVETGIEIKHFRFSRSSGVEPFLVEMEVSNVPGNQSTFVMETVESLPGAHLTSYASGGASEKDNDDDDSDDGRRISPGRRKGWWTRSVE